MLALAGPEPGELAPAELERLCRSLMGTLLRLARERDVGAQVGQQGWCRGPGGGTGGPRGPRCVGRWKSRLRCGVGVGGLWLAGL